MRVAQVVQPDHRRSAVTEGLAVAQPTRWDVGFIRRFMLFFGPISSVFDFATFGMLGVFHAGPALFRSGWFVESLATQTLVIFAIRTRRIPFFRSRPSLPLTLAALAVVTTGAVLPYTGRLARILGFRPLPGSFFLFLVLAILLMSCGIIARATSSPYVEPTWPTRSWRSTIPRPALSIDAT